MKKLLFAIFIFASFIASAANNALLLTKYNADNTNTILVELLEPPSSTIGLVSITGVTGVMRYTVPGSGITITTSGDYNYINAAAPTSSDIITALGYTPYNASNPAGYVDATALATKYTIPTCSTSNYLRGDGSCASFPSIPSSQVNSDWSASSGVAQILNKPSLASVATSGAYSDLSGKPTLFSGAYSDLTGKPTIPPAITLTTTGTSGAATFNSGTGALNIPNYAPGTGTVTSVVAGTGLSGGTITTSGTISMPNTGTAGTYSGVTTDAQGRVTAGTTRSFAYQTRSLNTCFQISSTRDSLVAYAVEIVTVSTLTSGQAGTVFLETFTNSGCSAGAQEIMRFSNGNVQSLGLSVTMTQTVTGTLNGVVPAGLWVKLRTNNDTSTPTFTARPGQEVLL